VPELGPRFREATDSTTAPAAVPRTAFWETLGDSTLLRLVAEAGRASPDVLAAEARIRGARAARLSATLDFAPTVTVGAGYTRRRLAAATFPGFGAGFPDQDLWDAGVDASWELDLFGRIRRNVQGQSALEGSAREDLRDVQVGLTAELVRTYFELRGSQGQLAVAQRNAVNQRRTLEVTRQRLDAGRGTAFDTERAQAQLSSTLAAIPALEARIAAAQYRIGVLVGRPPASVAPELATAVELPALPPTIDVPSPEALVRSRPDVRSAERVLAAQTAFVGAARAEYLPKLTLAGGAGFTATSLDSVGRSGTSRYSVGPVLSWPALNLGRVKAQADAARARAAEAQAIYQRTVLQALGDAETSLVNYRQARARLELLASAASASERAAELARLRFEGGVADFLQVLDAERTLLEAQDRLASGRTEATTALVDVYRALGGTWPEAGK
jgi:NodT family efflux transporter outer membrane factor (OMF) lipoprotein